MPELPEIEVLARDLRHHVVGKTIVDIHCGQPKALNMPLAELRERARGCVSAVDRHGKSAVLRLPAGRLWLHMGLGATVRLIPDELWPAAKFLSLRFAEGEQLTVEKAFMGHAYFVEEGVAPPGEKLGVDALDAALTPERLSVLLRSKPKVSVKAALMDQSLLAGIGNTYSDEILLRAGLHPAQRLGALQDDRLGKLHAAMQAVLGEAIARGGEPDWADLQGRQGRCEYAVHQARHCGRCGGAVQTLTLGSRTAYFCPSCQPEVR